MLPTEKIFSLSESELSKLLEEIKEKCKSGNLPSDEISRLTSHLNSIVSKFSTIQHGISPPDLAAMVIEAIKSAKSDLEYWQEKIKTLAEDQEKQKNLTGEAIEREREANDKDLKRFIAELDRSFENIRERDKEARLLANGKIEEFIRTTQTGLYGLLDKRNEIKEQIKLEKDHFDTLNQQVLNGGFLVYMQADLQVAHPTITLELLQAAHNDYWSNPKIRTEKPYGRFAESLGIKEEEINKHVEERGLLNTIKEMHESIGRTDLLEKMETFIDIDFVEKLLKIEIAVTSDTLTQAAKQELLATHNDILLKCDPEAFTAFFEQRSKKIAAITKDLEGIPKEAQAKRKELEEEKSVLLKDLNGLPQLVKQKSGGEESAAFKEMQEKVAALGGQIVADVPPPAPPPPAKSQGTVSKETTAAVPPVQPQPIPEKTGEAAPSKANVPDEKGESIRKELKKITDEIKETLVSDPDRAFILMGQQEEKEKELAAYESTKPPLQTETNISDSSGLKKAATLTRERSKSVGAPPLDIPPPSLQPPQPDIPPPSTPPPPLSTPAAQSTGAPAGVTPAATTSPAGATPPGAAAATSSSPGASPAGATPPAAATPAASSTTPQATEKEANVKAAAGLLTFERSCAFLGHPAPDAAATPEAKKVAMKPMIKSCVDKGQEVIKQIGVFEEALQAVSKGRIPTPEASKTLAGSMSQEFRSMMGELKKPLPPIYGIDFTDKKGAEQKIRESVDKTLLTWEEYAKDSGIDLQQKQTALEEAEKQFNALRRATIDLRVLQYAVGATGSMDIEAKDANSDKEWEARISRLRSDKSYADMAALGLADENFAKEWRGLHDKLGPDAYLARLKSETKEVIENELYSKIDRSGNEVFIVKVVNEHTLQTVIEAKKDQRLIDWDNAATKDIPLIENQCLANWKKVSFAGQETPLSRQMPERKGDWSGWVNNITRTEGMGWFGRSPLMKKLVQEVVGNNPERLREFMLDLQNASPEGRAAAIGYLTVQQRGILQKDATDRLEKFKKEELELTQIQPQLSPSDMQVKVARLDAEIANVHKELEMYAESDPKMLKVIEKEIPSLGEHYIARLDKLETKLENAEKLKESGEAEQNVADAEVEKDIELGNVQKLATPQPTPAQPQPPSTQLQKKVDECLVEQAKLDAEIKRLKGANEAIDTPSVTKLMGNVATASGLIPDGHEKQTTEKLVKANKKLLQAEKELKVINDDPGKLKTEISAAQEGLYGAAQINPELLKKFGTNPELLQKFWTNCAPKIPEWMYSGEAAAASNLLTPDQQKALQAEYTKLLPQFSKDLEKAETDTINARNEVRGKINTEEEAPGQSPQLRDYIATQKLLIAKQEALEALERHLRAAESQLEQEEENNNEAEVTTISKDIEHTKSGIERAQKEIVDLKKAVKVATELVKDPKTNPKATGETKVVKELEKSAQSLQSKETAQKKAAGKLAAAERELGELVGSTNVPADVAKTVKEAVKNTSSLVMVMKWAQNISDTLNPREAQEEREEKEKKAAPSVVPKPGHSP